MPNGRKGFFFGDVASIVVVLGQSALITALVIQGTRRRRAETALRRSESELRASRDELRTLAGRLIAAREAERTHIARELHDDLGQKLALLAMDVHLLENMPTLREGAAHARAISRRTAELAADIQNVSHQLHPSHLEALGLVAAMQSLCREFSSQHGLNVEFVHESVPSSLPQDLALGIFRIVQEALHNIVKHSGARHAEIRLSGSASMAHLRVADSGSGFQESAYKGSGMGLLSMRERVRMLGGEMAIHATPGAGTRIGVRVPLRRDDEAASSGSATRA